MSKGLLFNEQKAEKKTKGVPKQKVRRDLDMKDYEARLHEHVPKNVNFNAIRSKNRQIYSINQSKFGLVSYNLHISPLYPLYPHS